MAQYIAVKARTLYALPPAVSFEQGCLVEPFAVGMHAVLRSGLAAGQTAAVIGDGTIGLMTLIAAKSQGAQVCISGHHTRPMQLAAQLGALDCAQLPQLTAERGADVVYDAVGSQSSFTQAMELVRKGGRIMVIGNHTRTIDFPLQRCITEQIDVQFSYSSAGEYPVGQRKALPQAGQVGAALGNGLQADRVLPGGGIAFRWPRVRRCSTALYTGTKA